LARLPLWLELAGRRVLVVGGGRVGTRRALMFAEAGAEVRVVGLAFSRELEEAARRGRVELVELDASREEALRPYIEWADIVVAATSEPRVNEAVWRLARGARKWVNDATDAARTEIVVPYRAVFLGGALEVAVTTQGRSGVVARHALERIKSCLEGDTVLEKLYEAMWRVKPVLKALLPDGRARFPIYFRAEEAVLEAIEGGGDPLRAAARAVAEALREHGVEVSEEEVYRMMLEAREPIRALSEQAGGGRLGHGAAGRG